MEPASLILAPTPDPRRFKAEDGRILTPPQDWTLLPPGDAGLTRRVKDAGPTWTVIEKRGRKKFSKGVWAPAANIDRAREQLELERADPSYAKRLAASAARREQAQAEYVDDFHHEVRTFLRFAPTFTDLASKLATAVTTHATPVGSGTVARTKRIEINDRAEAAVIAWLRHQTTTYDRLKIARIKGLRREIRQELAALSRDVLDLHRIDRPHEKARCPLCRVF